MEFFCAKLLGDSSQKASKRKKVPRVFIFLFRPIKNSDANISPRKIRVNLYLEFF
jgi:hypothetical protein